MSVVEGHHIMVVGPMSVVRLRRDCTLIVRHCRHNSLFLSVDSNNKKTARSFGERGEPTSDAPPPHKGQTRQEQ